MNIRKIFFLAILLLIFFFAKMNSQDIILSKKIPIIEYESLHFLSKVREAFENEVINNYVKITNEKDVYYLNKGMGEVPISTEFPIYQRNIIMNNDSVFCLYFKIEGEDCFEGETPIKYFGVLNGGSFFIYKNEENPTPYTIYEIIAQEYGGIYDAISELTKFVQDNRNKNTKCIIPTLSEKGIIEELRSDYELFERYFPDSTDKTIDLFLDFLVKSTSISSGKRQEIKESIYQAIINRNNYGHLKLPICDKIYVVGYDVSSILKEELNSTEYQVFLKKDKTRKFVLNKYLDIEPFYLKYSKTNDFTRDEMDWLFATDEERLEHVKEIVYGKGVEK